VPVRLIDIPQDYLDALPEHVQDGDYRLTVNLHTGRVVATTGEIYGDWELKPVVKNNDVHEVEWVLI
jgi:hypothetical protein